MCINLLYKIKNVAIYLLVAGMVTGCAQEDEGMIHDGDDMSAPSYVSLRFVFPHAASTRANPTGGEAGDGEEAGQGYEQDVSNITLFFYQAGDNDNGVNRNGDIDFATSVYVDDIKSDVIGPIETGALKKGKKYHLLAVANAGDLRNIKSLDSLRTKTIEQVYSLSGTTYGNFVMASAGNESNVLNITDDNSKYNPATTTIEIERLAARVDYKVSDEYSLAEKEKKAVITRAMLVNLYNQPTYILKRVAADVSGTGLLYLGDETTDNYVIDPLTVSKTDNTGIDVSSKWYDRYFPNLTDKVNEDNKTDWEDWLIKGDEITNH